MLQEQGEPLEATLADLIVALTEEADRLNRTEGKHITSLLMFC